MAENKTRSRGWCFTQHNYNDSIGNGLTPLRVINNILREYQENGIKYMIVGKEICPTTKAKHLQGYLFFKNARHFKAVKKLFHITVRLVSANGSPKQNQKYCSKEGNYVEKGDVPQAGARTDIYEALETAKTGVTYQELLEKHPEVVVKYNNSMTKILDLYTTKRNQPPWVAWVWGSTGCGKTRYATEIEPESYYIKDHSIWWNGYSQQKVIIIDDFETWNFRDLLRLLDRYPYQGQIKGGYIQINSPKIVITCDREPKDCFIGYKKELPQLLRRITEIKNLTIGNTWSTEKEQDLKNEETSDDDLDCQQR